MIDGIAGGGPISNANLLALVFGNGAVAGAGIVGADMRLVFLLGMSGKSLPTNFCIGAVVWQGFSCQLGDHPCRLSENDYQYNKFDASGAECSFCSKCFDENTGAPCTHTSAMIQDSSCKCGKAIFLVKPSYTSFNTCSSNHRHRTNFNNFPIFIHNFFSFDSRITSPPVIFFHRFSSNVTLSLHTFFKTNAL